MAEAYGKTTMSTVSSDEMSWRDKQVTHNTGGPAWDHLTERRSLVLAEIGAHIGVGKCSTMQELAGTTSATELGGTGRHLVDSTRRRLLAKSLEQRPRHSWLSLRCGSYFTPSRTVNNFRTDAQKQTKREKRGRLQQENKGALAVAGV